MSTAQGAVVAFGEVVDMVGAMKALRDKKIELEAMEEEIKGKLIITLGDAGDTLIDADGSPLITYKLGKGRTIFDAKALEKDDPETYKKYLKVGEPQRRFLLKG
jgi:hypothetical protein